MPHLEHTKLSSTEEIKTSLYFCFSDYFSTTPIDVAQRSNQLLHQEMFAFTVANFISVKANSTKVILS